MFLQRTTADHLSDEDHLILVLIKPSIDETNDFLMADIP
jgi:hypothetical protein